VTEEEVFTYGAPNLKFGPGASDEIGYDLHSNYGSKRVLVVTDERIASTGTPQKVADQMGKYDVEAHVFDGVHVEPTDVSLQEAVTGPGSMGRGMPSSPSAAGRASTPRRPST